MTPATDLTIDDARLVATTYELVAIASPTGNSATVAGRYTAMLREAGQVALVTGAGRGIGRGIRLRLAAEGADVVLNGIQQSGDLDDVAPEIAALLDAASWSS